MTTKNFLLKIFYYFPYIVSLYDYSHLKIFFYYKIIINTTLIINTALIYY